MILLLSLHGKYEFKWHFYFHIVKQTWPWKASRKRWLCSKGPYFDNVDDIDFEGWNARDMQAELKA